MGVRAAIIVFIAVVILLFALAAVGYYRGGWEMQPNPPTVSPEQPAEPPK